MGVRFSTDRHYVPRTLRGFTYSPTTGRRHARRGQPWSVAEDKRLRKLVRKQFRGVRRGRGYEAWWRVANALGRTALACMARWQTLKVVDAHKKMAKRRRRK